MAEQTVLCISIGWFIENDVVKPPSVTIATVKTIMNMKNR